MLFYMLKLYFDLVKYMLSLGLDGLVYIVDNLEPQLKTDLPDDLLESVTNIMERLQAKYEAFQNRITTVIALLEKTAKNQDLVVNELVLHQD